MAPPARDPGGVMASPPAAVAPAEAMSATQRLMQGALGGLVLKGLGVVLGFGSQMLLARALGVDGFGIYATVIAWSGILALLGGVGMPLSAVRFLSIYADRSDWAAYRGFLTDALRLTVVSSMVIVLLVLALFLVVPALRPTFPAMVVGAPMILLLGLAALANGVFLAERMPLRADGLNNVVRPLLLIMLIGAPFALGIPVGAQWALGLTVLAGLVVVTVLAGVLWPILRGRWAGERQVAERPEWFRSGAAILVTTAAFAIVERLDTILVSALLSPSDAGAYAIAARLTMMIAVALSPVTAVVSPICARLLARSAYTELQRTMRHAVFVASAIAGGLALGLVLFPNFLLGLFGPGFGAAASALQVLALGQFGLAIWGPAGGMLAMSGRNRVLVVTMLGTLVLHLVLCLALIPWFGMLGASIATAVALFVNGPALALACWILLRVDTTLFGGIYRMLRPQSRVA